MSPPQFRLEDVLGKEQFLQILAAKSICIVLVAREHLNQASEVSDEVALVAVSQDCWDGCVVKLDIVVMNLDKVDGRVDADKWPQRSLHST